MVVSAKAVENSSNRKLSVAGKVSVTMVSQASCPTTCPFYKSGCYAESGPQGIHTSRLNKSEEKDVLQIAKEEAKAILALTGKNNLRLHVVGDCTTDDSAKEVSSAAEIHMSKNNKKVWTYTHAHNVERKSWGKVSVLRSCENITQVKKATEEGFASCIVVSEFKKNTAYKLDNEYTGIPCPQQTGKAADCESCKLCWNDIKLHKSKRVILFSAHGTGKKKMLPVIN